MLGIERSNAPSVQSQSCENRCAAFRTFSPDAHTVAPANTRSFNVGGERFALAARARQECRRAELHRDAASRCAANALVHPAARALPAGMPLPSICSPSADLETS